MPATGLSTSNLRYLYHHVFFPPKLPQEDDSSVHNDKNLLESLLDAVISFQNNSNNPDKLVCNVVIDMLRGHRDLLNEDGSLCGQKLVEQLNCLRPQGQPSLISQGYVRGRG